LPKIYNFLYDFTGRVFLYFCRIYIEDLYINLNSITKNQIPELGIGKKSPGFSKDGIRRDKLLWIL